MRIGHGYDVHRLVEDRKLILGGVEIEYTKGLLGHSDADVLTHAIIDALFGAACCGDIGYHFPDSNPDYKNISSLRLLKKSAQIIFDAGYTIENIDATILAEKPKLSPYIVRIRQQISETLSIPMNCVSVKATTEEGLGFTGKGEGIAAHAVCLLKNIL
ncbi:MAG: 2-C-methyl-D-erythritol 2,4-cyclodiphosphate synthase [Clostridiales bacterium]|nr:2-C-methyl-D-erythritol 2,4-cyclodiphosphate synthase [Clostridiales bacterium]